MIPRMETVRKLDSMIAERRKTLKELHNDYSLIDSRRRSHEGTVSERGKPEVRKSIGLQETHPRPTLSPTGISSRKQAKLEEILEKRVERLARIVKEKREQETVKEKKGKEMTKRREKHVIFADTVEERRIDEEESSSNPSTNRSSGTSDGQSSSSSPTSPSTASSESSSSTSRSKSPERNNNNDRHEEDRQVH